MPDAASEILRQWDRPRYLSLLFAPDSKRADLMALLAFNAEIARIPLAVSEPQIGLIRLQWWRDTLEGMDQAMVPDHPVAAALASCVARHALPLQPLLDLVDAHEHDLYADQMPDIPALEAYLGQTQSILIQLSAMILDRSAAPAVADAAGYAGVAYGMAQIISDPKRFANLVPQNASLEDVAEMAVQRLAEFKSCVVPTVLRPAFHHVSLTDMLLQSPGRPPAQWRMQWRLWRSSRQAS